MSNRRAASNTAKARKVHESDEASRDAGSARPNFRLIVLMAMAGALVSLLAILVFSERPDIIASADPNRPTGGESVVNKSAPPAPAPPPAVAAKDEPERAVEPVREPQPAPPPAPAPSIASPAVPGDLPATIPVSVPVTATLPPQPDHQVPAAPEPVQPQIPIAVTVSAPPPPGNDDGANGRVAPAPDVAPSADPAPLPDRRPTAAVQPGTGSSQRLTLPWQTASGAATAPVAAPGGAAGRTSTPAPLPSSSEVSGWVKSSAREFVGGVDAEGMPLYRFEVWLEPPVALSRRIRKVSYAYLAPSAQPAQQSSSDAASGFKVRFGAAACAEKATVTLTLDDGQEQRVNVDGCKILN